MYRYYVQQPAAKEIQAALAFLLFLLLNILICIWHLRDHRIPSDQGIPAETGSG